MSDTFFIIWQNYDGSNFEECSCLEDAEKRVSELQCKMDESDSYGWDLKVVRGKRLKIVPIEVATKIKLE